MTRQSQVNLRYWLPVSGIKFELMNMKSLRYIVKVSLNKEIESQKIFLTHHKLKKKFN